MIVLAALGAAGYIAYDLKQKDDLNVDSFQSELSKHWDSAKEQSSKLANVSKEQWSKLRVKWDEQYAKLDWEKIKASLKVSDKDLEEYKKFMKWAHSDESEPDMTTESETGTIVPQSSTQSESTRSKPNQVVKQKKPDEKALALLREAKALNRKAIPNQPDYQKNLKKAVQAYEAAAHEYEILLKSPGISKAERASFDATLSQINQQIYWGKKFTSL